MLSADLDEETDYFKRPPHHDKTFAEPKWHLYDRMTPEDKVVARCGFKFLGTVEWRKGAPESRTEMCRKCVMLVTGSYNTRLK